MWLTLILATIIFYLLWHCYDTIHAFWLSRKINGPQALPFIGNALLFVNKTPAGMIIFNKHNLLSSIDHLHTLIIRSMMFFGRE